MQSCSHTVEIVDYACEFEFVINYQAKLKGLSDLSIILEQPLECLCGRIMGYSNMVSVPIDKATVAMI
jgi:hypothetical protein